MRVLVISDIHSNLEAFQAVLEDAGPVDKIWCLGDVVGYGPDPNACVDLLRAQPHCCVAGNHDWATLGRLDLQDFNPDAREANLWNRSQLTPDNLAYLESLPERLVEGPFTLVHGSPQYPVWEYVLYCSTAETNADYFDTPYCFVGHTHTPAIFHLTSGDNGASCESVAPRYEQALPLSEDRLFVNPGSVGQPRDGDPRASYVLLDLDKMIIEHRRVAYPIAKTQAKMVELDLPMRLVLRLGYGW